MPAKGTPRGSTVTSGRGVMMMVERGSRRPFVAGRVRNLQVLLNLLRNLLLDLEGDAARHLVLDDALLHLRLLCTQRSGGADGARASSATPDAAPRVEAGQQHTCWACAACDSF